MTVARGTDKALPEVRGVPPSLFTRHYLDRQSLPPIVLTIDNRTLSIASRSITQIFSAQSGHHVSRGEFSTNSIKVLTSVGVVMNHSAPGASFLRFPRRIRTA